MIDQDAVVRPTNQASEENQVLTESHPGNNGLWRALNMLVLLLSVLALACQGMRI